MGQRDLVYGSVILPHFLFSKEYKDMLLDYKSVGQCLTPK